MEAADWIDVAAGVFWAAVVATPPTAGAPAHSVTRWMAWVLACVWRRSAAGPRARPPVAAAAPTGALELVAGGPASAVRGCTQATSTSTQRAPLLRLHRATLLLPLANRPSASTVSGPIPRDPPPPPPPLPVCILLGATTTCPALWQPQLLFLKLADGFILSSLFILLCLSFSFSSDSTHSTPLLTSQPVCCCLRVADFTLPWAPLKGGPNDDDNNKGELFLIYLAASLFVCRQLLLVTLCLLLLLLCLLFPPFFTPPEAFLAQNFAHNCPVLQYFLSKPKSPLKVDLKSLSHQLQSQTDARLQRVKQINII